MAAINDLVLSVSGNVSYDDGSSGPFEGYYQNSTKFTPTASATTDNFDELFGDKSAAVNAMFARLPGTITVLFGSTNRSKTVSDFAMRFTGRVSYDDGTSGDFGVAYEFGASRDLVGTAGDDFYETILDDGTYILKVRDVLRLLASTTTVAD